MGVKDILKRIFTKEKKVVICGLDSAGKTTLVSFLQNGRRHLVRNEDSRFQKERRHLSVLLFSECPPSLVQVRKRWDRDAVLFQYCPRSSYSNRAQVPRYRRLFQHQQSVCLYS